MDFSLLTEPLASKSYEKIADICDNLLLQAILLLEFLYLSLLWVFFFFFFFLDKHWSPYLVAEQATAEGVAYQDQWPYAIHLLGHIYADDM
jgi:COP9 signalosome complex subunit 8